MNDGSISPELRRTAAAARMLAAKQAFTVAAVAYLKNDKGAEVKVQAALSELGQARTALAAPDVTA